MGLINNIIKKGLTILNLSGTEATYENLSGSAPSNLVGTDGDFFTDVSTGYVWAKTAGIWAATGSSAIINSIIPAEIIRVQKNPGPNDFSSIVSAINSITDNSVTKPYEIQVSPGVYTEDTIITKPYVSIKGGGIEQTIIQIDSPSKNVVELCDHILFENLSIGGATNSGKSTFHYSGINPGVSCFLNRIKFLSSDILVHIEPTGISFSIGITSCLFGGTSVYTKGFFATGNSGGNGRILLLGCSTTSGGTPPSEFAIADGTGTQIVVNSSQIRNGTVGGDCFVARNAGALRLTGVNINGWARAIYMPNTGSATTIAATGINFENNTLDIVINHPGSSGSINASPNFLKTQINSSSSVFIVGKDPKIVTVATKGGDFTSISDAANNIIDASVSNRYIISVGPGIFVEPEIILPDFVSVIGSSIQTTVVEPNNNSHHIFNLGNNCEVSFLTIQNAGSGFAAIASLDKGNFTQCHKLSIYDCDIGVIHTSVTRDSFCYLEYVDIDNVYTTAIKTISSNGFISFLNTENFYTFPDASNTGDNILVDGADAFVDVNSFGLNGTGNDNGIKVINGGSTLIQGGYFVNLENAIYSPPSGSGSVIRTTGVDFSNCVKNINIDNANTTGTFSGFSEFSKTFINFASSFFITNKDAQIITVAKKGGDFDSIKDAIDNISDASISKPYLISVGPGIFIEDIIVMKSYVRIQGVGDQQTEILASDPNQVIIRGCDNSAVANCIITGATGSLGKGIYMEGSGTFVPFLLENIIFGANYTQLELFANTAASIIQIRNCRMGGAFSFTNGFIVHNNPGKAAQLAFDAFIFQDVIPGFATGDLFNISGTGCSLILSDILLRVGTPTGACIVVQDGAEVRAQSTSIRGFTKGIWAKNVGAAPFVRALSIGLEGNTTDILIEHPGTTGNFTGTADQTKVSIDSASSFTALYSDFSSGDIIGTGLLKLGFQGNTPTDVSTLIVESSTMGLMEGGVIAVSGGFTATISEGFGYLEIEPEILKRVDWTDTFITLPANSERYIFFNENEILSFDAGFPETKNNILLGRVITNATGIEIIDSSPLNAEHTSNLYDIYHREGFGPVYASGSIVMENVIPLHLDVTSGKYFLSMNKFAPSGGSNITFSSYYRNGVSGGWNVTSTNLTEAKFDNNSGTLQAPSGGYYVKHSFYVNGDGDNEKYFLVYSQVQYSNLVLAEGGDIPLPPPYFTEGICLIANIILKQGSTNISEIQDARPQIGFRATGTTATNDHSSLIHLSSDDHLQYLLASGSRSMSGNLDMGGNQITNVGNVDGVDISAHALRHLPNGSDPEATAAPTTNLDANSANAVGIQNSFSRSDHVHAISTGNVISIGSSGNGPGVSANLARSDHRHNHGDQLGGTQHSEATTSIAGFLSAADKTKIDGLPSTAPPTSRNLIAGSGLTGGGDLSTDRTFDVGTNADGSIKVNADDLQVGVLATDNQHGVRSSGALHAIASASGNGFMSVSSFNKLQNIGGTRLIKSGTVGGSSFTGNPKTFAVTFNITQFLNTNYAISIVSDTNRTWTYSLKSVSGFTISANANSAFSSGEVSWTAIANGETQE